MCTKLSLRAEQPGCPPPPSAGIPGGGPQPRRGGACVWLSCPPWSCSVVLLHGGPCSVVLLCGSPVLWFCSVGVPAPWSCSVGVPALWGSLLHGGPCSVVLFCGPALWGSCSMVRLCVGPCSVQVPAPWGSLLHGPAPWQPRAIIPHGAAGASPKPPALLPASARSRQLDFEAASCLPPAPHPAFAPIQHPCPRGPRAPTPPSVLLPQLSAHPGAPTASAGAGP